jgi:hypothetical protein
MKVRAVCSSEPQGAKLKVLGVATLDDTEPVAVFIKSISTSGAPPKVRGHNLFTDYQAFVWGELAQSTGLGVRVRLASLSEEMRHGIVFSMSE